uniref:Amino acid transporter n=1 Tax=Panagrolaimus sp. PS1159 TaxID=55785 RepID=A0AC35G3V0_9BILA
MSDKNLLTLPQAIAYCISDIIGSGIFISPTGILKYSGTSYLSLIIWILSGIISFFGALIYIEFATIVKKSGGDFAYLTFVGWKPIATSFYFVGSILTYSSILAIQTSAIGYYLSDGILSFLTYKPENLSVIRILLGYCILIPTIFLNFFSLRKSAGRFQLIATFIKVLIVIFVIGNGAVYLARFGTKNGGFNETFYNKNSTVEVGNPRRTLPIATFIGLIVATVVYVCMNSAYFLVLSTAEFKSTETVVTLFFEKSISPSFSYVVPFLITFILIGSLNATIFGASRYLFVGSRAGLMPSAFSTLHSSKSPRVAVFAQLILSIIMSFIGNLNDLINYVSYAISLQQITVLFALFYFRFKNDAPKNSWRNPWFVLIIYLFNFFIAIYAIGLLICGLIAHYIIIRPKTLPLFLQILDRRLLIISQIIFDTESPIKNDNEQK